MGFATALSGLAAATSSLQVIGNNLANANTTGFKESRAEFADVYNSTGPTTAGSGVRVTEVAQQFNQGNIESTQNNLDLAIAGNGFFAMGEASDSTSPTAYTRNGAFHLSPEGFITNDSGNFLMGGAPLGTNISDGFSIGAPIPLKIDTAQGAPAATSKIDLKVNLDSRSARFAVGSFPGFTESVAASGVFDVPPDVNTYNDSTSATIFDSLGNPHTLSTYFINVTPNGAASSTWESYVYLDGKALTAPGTIADANKGTSIPITFDSLGNLTSDTTGTDTAALSDDDFVFSNIVIAPTGALNVTADPLTFSINPAGSTQYAAQFGVNDLQQDGFASGNLTGVSINKEGIVLARYSNGTSSPLGQVLMGRFTSNQGLDKIGDSTWQESVASGTVVLGVAGGNNFGDIVSSSLENSNADVATQLVRLIVAQQTYQANAQTISTEDEIIQRILQL